MDEGEDTNSAKGSKTTVVSSEIQKKSTICAITNPSLFHSNLMVRDSLLGKCPCNTGLVGFDLSAAH